MLMVAPAVEGIDLFKIAGRSISGWIPSCVHDAHAAAQAGSMTLEELEHCFYQAVVDDYHQDWDGLRGLRRSVLWEQAVAPSGSHHTSDANNRLP